MPVEYMPEAIQERISETVDALKVIESLNQKVDEFKQKILQAMQEHNIKSIKNDALSITFVPESETVSFDTKRFAKENPELAKNYEKKIVKKPYIIIKLK